MSWYKKSPILLSVVLFIHITLLDLFFITFNGPVFLWQENLQLRTVLSHIVVVAMSVVFYHLVTKSRVVYRRKVVKIPERAWLLCSLALFFAILLVI